MKGNKFFLLLTFFAFVVLFGFVFNIQPAKAVSCTQNEICYVNVGNISCDGIRYCTNGQYGGCVKNNSNCGGGVTARCGDGVCNGTETSTTCFADCGGGGGGGGGTCDPATVNCEGKICGAYGGCGVICQGSCTGGKFCDPKTIKCMNANLCIDSDNTITQEGYFNGESYRVKGTTKSTNFYTGEVTEKTDSCAGPKSLNEYYCVKGGDGNIATDSRLCSYNYPACIDGACYKPCVLDFDCVGSTKGKFCDTTTHQCGARKCDKKPDGKDPYVRGTVTDINGVESTDLCYEEEKKVYEYSCNANGLAEWEINSCPYGCKDGACNKTCTPTITEKNCQNKYPGQCKPNSYDGCGNFLDCSGSCPNKQYCNIGTRQCTKLPPKNCCIGLWGADSGKQIVTEDPCYKLKKTNCLKQDCNWITPLSPAQPFCGNRTAKWIDEDMKNNQPSCQSSIILPQDDDATDKTLEFIKNNNCRTRVFNILEHTSPAYCGPLYEYLSACYKCDAGSCAFSRVKHGGCSISANKQEIEDGALGLWGLLRANNDKTSIWEIATNQAPSTRCMPTRQTVKVSWNGIKNTYESCDTIRSYLFCVDTIPVSNPAIICIENSGDLKIAKCCPYLSYWSKWAFVSSAKDKCPVIGPTSTSTPPTFSNLLRNVASLLKSASNALNNAFSNVVLDVVFAISVALVGIWWLVLRFFLKK